MPTYTQSILEERAERDRRLIANPLNWLALCGLFPLVEGENTFGSDPSNSIVLPNFPAAQTGVLTLTSGRVSLTKIADSVTVNGKAPEPRPLRSDQEGEPDDIQAGSITLRIIGRGGQWLVRTWDRESPAVRDFKGLHWFPVNPNFCITGSFTAYDPPLTRRTYDAIGNEHETAFSGWVDFSVDGVSCRLEAEDAGDELLLNFTDQTKNDTTYPGGRYLVLPKPPGSEVTLDFNRAINWPCAYTSFATCPLPPFENRLAVRIEAGEKRFHD
jgi:uncharacterized protein (DUF1684 family)